MKDDLKEQPILSITQLNQQVHYLLEQSFPFVYIKGEISNFVQPASGHWYFSLKDESAQVRCAMFRMKNRQTQFKVESGMQVIATARVSLYQPRGDFQLIIEKVEELGVGALQKAFDALKKKLDKAGLFDEKHKQPLPDYPKQIGVVTSATGAALQDILRILKRRMPSIPVIVYPTLVQGELAAPNIVKQIQLANQRKECDVLILARGGGSIEDLWAFNEEPVAQAVFKSKLPIVTGVGHQIDFTIVDFVSDYRAATPSAAAEIVSPNREELLDTLLSYQQHLARLLMQTLEQTAQRLDWLNQRLQRLHPLQMLEQQQIQLNQLKQRMLLAYQAQFAQLKSELQGLARTLHATSPLATLGRGYAIIRHEKSGKLIRKAAEVKVEDHICTQLNQFELSCTVNSIKKQ